LANDLNFTIQDMGRITLTQAGDHQTNLFGSTWMIIQFPDANTYPNHKELLRAFAIDFSPTQLLLGTDFLCRFPHSTFLWRKPELQMGPHRIPLLYRLFLGDLQRAYVNSPENVHVPSYTSMMMVISVQPQYKEQPVSGLGPLFLAIRPAVADRGAYNSWYAPWRLLLMKLGEWLSPY